MTQIKGKWDSIRKFKWYEDATVFGVFILFIYLFTYFCLEPTVKKETWMRTTSVTVMEFFSRVPF